MRVSVRLVLLSYCYLYLVACPSPSVLIPSVGGGDLFYQSSISRAGGLFSTSSLLARCLVSGVLTGVICGDYICASDGMVMFGWMMFGEINVQVVLSYFPIQ